MDALGFIDLLTKAGPYGLAAVLFFFYRQERAERLDAQKALEELLRETVREGLNAVNANTGALRSLRNRLFRDDVAGRMERDDD